MSRVRGGQVFVEIGADPRRLFKSLNDLNRHIGKIGSQLQGLGTRMAGFGAALAVPIGLATRQFATFDDAIRATAAVSGATGSALQSMNDRARELGATTSFTAVQVAELMTALGRAGFKPDEINSMTLAMLDLARATGTDSALATKIAAETLRQFSLDASHATRVADVLTKAANSTNNTVEAMGEALSYAGLNASQAGMSIEETAALLGALGNIGIQGSNAGTVLRRLVTITGAEAEKLGEIFGVATLDAARNVRPLIDVFGDIADATNELPSGDRLKRFNDAFGLLGITGAQALAGAVGDIRELNASLADAGGTARKTAQEMDAGLGGSMRIAFSAIEGTALAVGEALAPSLQKLIGLITNAAGSMTSFIKRNQDVIVGVAKGVAAFTAAGVAALALGTVVSVLSGTFGILLASATAILAPLAAAATAAMGVLFAFAGATVKVIAYGTASVAAATAATAAWLAANAAMVGMVGFLGLIAVNVLGVLGGMNELGHAANNVAQAGRDAMSVFVSMGKTADQTFRGIADSLNSNNLEGAMAVGMAGLKAVFTRGASAFMNSVDEWGVNLVNTFDFYISQIPFLRFLGKDTYRFSVFGDSTQGNNADSRADARGAALGDRQQQRIQGNREVFGQFDNTLQDTRLTNSMRREARDLFGSIEAAKTNREMDELGFALMQLKDSGRVAADEITKLEAAYEAAAARIASPLPEPQASVVVGSGQLLEPASAGGQSVFEQQAEDVLKTLADSWSESEVKNAIGEAQALIQTRAVSRGMAENLQSAIQAAGQLIDPKAIQDRMRRDTANQSEVVGTFSGAALGQMGFGQNLAQRQLDELMGIRRGVEKLDPVALVAD